MSVIGRDERDLNALVARTPHDLGVHILGLWQAIDEQAAERANDHAALRVAFDYFRHRDLMNAYLHTPADVRYSPITIMLADVLGVIDELDHAWVPPDSATRAVGGRP